MANKLVPIRRADDVRGPYPVGRLPRPTSEAVRQFSALLRAYKATIRAFLGLELEALSKEPASAVGTADMGKLWNTLLGVTRARSNVYSRVFIPIRQHLEDRGCDVLAWKMRACLTRSGMTREHRRALYEDNAGLRLYISELKIAIAHMGTDAEAGAQKLNLLVSMPSPYHDDSTETDE